jgi:excisionase family DNA binding protein|tara:strand:- start:5362 stop:5547 length:186 start_codon:yes stop_codon:yes gene_type:complete
MTEQIKLLSTTDMAKHLSVHRITVVRMAIDGRIPFLKISDTEYRYDRDKVIAALEINNKRK